MLVQVKIMLSLLLKKAQLQVLISVSIYIGMEREQSIPVFCIGSVCIVYIYLCRQTLDRHLHFGHLVLQCVLRQLVPDGMTAHFASWTSVVPNGYAEAWPIFVEAEVLTRFPGGYF